VYVVSCEHMFNMRSFDLVYSLYMNHRLSTVSLNMSPVISSATASIFICRLNYFRESRCHKLIPELAVLWSETPSARTTPDIVEGAIVG
jgi:hypothetical protein